MTISVFYNKQQTVKDNKSISPSAGKPALVAELFSKYKEVKLIEDFNSLTADELALAHNPNYIEGVLNLTIPNGFGNSSSDIAKSLHWTTGSMHAAALHAFLNNTVAMSPTSGFHHARYNGGEGFCTFNGLMISAILMKKQFDLKKVGIIDFDAHYGNGTDDIIEKLKIDWVINYTFGDFCEKIRFVFDKWLLNLPEILEHKFKGTDLLYYQAGVDPHVDDMFGGYLTSEQMRLRDEIVFKFCKKNNIPVAWNLAGGYQTPIQKVLELHETTLKECIKVYEVSENNK